MSLPYYKRFPRDFLDGTIGLALETKGAYAIILDLIYMKDGRLPDDARYIAGHLGCSVRKWTTIRDDLIEAGKIQVADRVISNTRADDLLEDHRKYQAKQAENRANPNKNNGAESPPSNQSKSQSKSIEEPPTPKGAGEINLDRFSKALSLAADAGCDFETLAERIHKAQPVVEGKRRSVLADVTRALQSAIKRGGKPSAIWLAIQAYYDLPASTKDGGQYARGSAVILNKDRWKEFLGGAVIGGLDLALAPVAFNGPAALRESVVALLGETFARTWIDSCTWDGDTRTLEARNAYGASMLNTELEGWLKKMKVNVAVKGSSR